MSVTKEQFFKTTRQYFQGVYEIHEKQNDLIPDEQSFLSCPKNVVENETSSNQ